MKKSIFKKLGGLFLCLAMGLGVAVGVTAGNKASEVRAAENTVHDFPKTYHNASLNSKAKVNSIHIDDQGYPIKQVTISGTLSNTSQSKVDATIKIGGELFATGVVGGPKTWSYDFTSTESMSGAVDITFVNNNTGTGKGTLVINNVKLTEGASAPAENMTDFTVSLTDATKIYYAGDKVEGKDLTIIPVYPSGNGKTVTNGTGVAITSGATLSEGNNILTISYTDGNSTITGKTLNISNVKPVSEKPLEETFLLTDTSLSGSNGSFSAGQGNASTAPRQFQYKNSIDVVTVYQNGGYYLIKANDGYTVHSVTLYPSGEYASTTIKILIADEDQGNEPKSSDDGISVGTSSKLLDNLDGQFVYIICYGTDKNTRLSCSKIDVTYSAGKTITSLNVASPKTAYKLGEDFTEPTVNDQDGSPITSGLTFSGFSSTSVGDKTITVSHSSGVSTSFTVHVYGISSITLSGTASGVVGGSWNFGSVQVTATWGGQLGTSNITSNCTLTSTTAPALGLTTLINVKVIYSSNGTNAEFLNQSLSVTVQEKENTIKALHDALSAGSYSGDYTFDGTVTAFSGNSFWLQDRDYGFLVYNKAISENAIGKHVSVTSTIQIYNGEYETSYISSASITGTDSVIQPTIVTSASQLAGLHQGILINVNNLVLTETLPYVGGNQSNFTGNISLGGSNVVIFSDKYAQNNFGLNNFEIGDHINLNNVIADGYLDGGVTKIRLRITSSTSAEKIENTVESISINTNPQLVYDQYDVLDLSALKINVVRSLTGSEVVEYDGHEEEFTVSPEHGTSLTNAGEFTLSVSYGGKTDTSLTITVNEDTTPKVTELGDIVGKFDSINLDTTNNTFYISTVSAVHDDGSLTKLINWSVSPTDAGTFESTQTEANESPSFTATKKYSQVTITATSNDNALLQKEFTFKIAADAYYVEIDKVSYLQDGMKILIGANKSTDSNDYWVNKAYAGGNNIPAASVNYDPESDCVYFDDSADGCATPLTIKKVTAQGNTDKWMFVDSEGYYLYAASSTSNHLKGVKDPTLDTNYYFSITKDGDTFKIIASGTNRPLMRCNLSNNTPMISCYADSATTGLAPRIFIEGRTLPESGNIESITDISVNPTSFEIRDSALLTAKYSPADSTEIPTIEVKSGSTGNVEIGTINASNGNLTVNLLGKTAGKVILTITGQDITPVDSSSFTVLPTSIIYETNTLVGSENSNLKTLGKYNDIDGLKWFTSNMSIKDNQDLTLSSDSTKGMQIGSSSAPANYFELTSQLFVGQAYTSKSAHIINDICVNASVASGGSATLDVLIDGVSLTENTPKELTPIATSYHFNASGLSGHITIVFRNNAEKAVFLKSITIKGERDDELSEYYSIAQSLETIESCECTSAEWSSWKATNNSEFNMTYDDIMFASSSEFRNITLLDHAIKDPTSLKTSGFDAIDKYNYIDVERFGGSGIDMARNTSLLSNLNNTDASVWVISAVALVGLTAIGGYFFYRKRKEI